MSNRHLARTMAMQVLYEWDFRGQDPARLPEVLTFVQGEFGKSLDDDGYVEKQVHGVVERIADIDERLNAFSPNWSVDTMTAIDRNVLRLGTYELVFDETIPSRVALNESIELGKVFGGEASGKFVNGVLGALYKDRLAKGVGKAIDEHEKSEKSEVISRESVEIERGESDYEDSSDVQI
jgi:transcription antitermination protein NusB